MDLNELKTLAAASLLAGSVQKRLVAMKPREDEIKSAVEVAQQIWEEVLRQEREG